MGLARSAAMPIAVAAALLCAPLAARTRPSENNAKRLIEKADCLAWLYNWYLAGPLYAEAEKLFEQTGDSRNALYAKIGRLRSEWETMSFPEVSEYLATELDSPLVENDPQLRLWILDAKGAADLEVNVASARRVVVTRPRQQCTGTKKTFLDVAKAPEFRLPDDQLWILGLVVMA